MNNGPQTGKTEWMLNHLLQSVMNGNPEPMLVIARDDKHKHELIRRVKEKLKNSDIKQLSGNSIYTYCSGPITFTTNLKFHIDTVGMECWTNGRNCFYDHYAEE